MPNDGSDKEINDSPEQHPSTPSAADRDVANKSDNQAAQGENDSENANRQPQPMQFVSRLRQFIIEPKHSNAIMAIFTGMIFFSRIAYTFFSSLQCRETRK